MPWSRFQNWGSQNFSLLFYCVFCILFLVDGATVNVYGRAFKRNFCVDDIDNRANTCLRHVFLSLKNVVNGNAKTIAIMKAIGYDDAVCRHFIFGAYRPISYLGFMIGTFCQYGLLKFMVSIVFRNVEGVPNFHFQHKAFFIMLIAFIITYEVCMFLYSLQIRKSSIKSVMDN